MDTLMVHKPLHHTTLQRAETTRVVKKQSISRDSNESGNARKLPGRLEGALSRQIAQGGDEPKWKRPEKESERRRSCQSPQREQDEEPQELGDKSAASSQNAFNDLSIPDPTAFNICCSGLENPDILGSFDFDTFLNTDAEGSGFGFDPEKTKPDDTVEKGPEHLPTESSKTKKPARAFKHTISEDLSQGAQRDRIRKLRKIQARQKKFPFQGERWKASASDRMRPFREGAKGASRFRIKK